MRGVYGRKSGFCSSGAKFPAHAGGVRGARQSRICGSLSSPRMRGVYRKSSMISAGYRSSSPRMRGDAEHDIRISTKVIQERPESGTVNEGDLVHNIPGIEA